MNKMKWTALVLVVGAFQGCSCEANFQAGGAQAPNGGATDAAAAALPAPAPAPAPAPMPVVGRARSTTMM